MYEGRLAAAAGGCASATAALVTAYSSNYSSIVASFTSNVTSLTRTVRSYETGVAGVAAQLLSGYSAALRASGFNVSATSTDPLARSLSITRSNVGLLLPAAASPSSPPAVATAGAIPPATLVGWLATAVALWNPILTFVGRAPGLCPALGAAAAADGGSALAPNSCVLPPRPLPAGGGVGLSRDVYVPYNVRAGWGIYGTLFVVLHSLCHSIRVGSSFPAASRSWTTLRSRLREAV